MENTKRPALDLKVPTVDTGCAPDGPERWRRAYRLILAARRPDRDEVSIDNRPPALDNAGK